MVLKMSGVTIYSRIPFKIFSRTRLLTLMAFWSKNPEFMPPIVFGEQEKGINFRGTGEQRPNLDGDRGTKKILVNREHKKTIFRFLG